MQFPFRRRAANVAAAFFALATFAVAQEAPVRPSVPTILSRAAETASIVPADAPALKNPKMRWAPNDFAKDPSVVRFRGKYRLYFSLPPQEKDGRKFGWTIGIAESDDLTDWRLVGNLLPMQECDQKGLCAPCARVLNDKIYLFYQTYGNGAKDAICLATSDDGLNFAPNPQNPIFRPSGDWTNGRAIDAEVVSFQGRFFLFAATRDPKGAIQQLVVATADANSDLGPSAWKLARDGAILKPELPWETRCVEAPTALERDGKLYLFYAGGYNNDPQHIGLAVSDNGLDWTRVWDVPFIPNGPTGQWNASESGHPGVFVDDDGQTWLFFQGNATRGKDWRLSRVKLDWRKTDAGIEIPTLADEN